MKSVITLLDSDYRFSEKLNGSRLALGTAALGGYYGKIDPGESVACLLYALENGIEAIDTSPAYGLAEQYFGIALRQFDGKRPFVSTSAGRIKSYTPGKASYDFSPDGIMNSVMNSLFTLGIPKVDILFLQDPDQVPDKLIQPVVETLNQLKEQGFTDQLGYGGNLEPRWEGVVRSGFFNVAMGFNRLNAINLEACTYELPIYQMLGMGYFASSPLVTGLLGRRFDELFNNPPDYFLPEWLTRASILKELARKYRLDLSTLAHQFLFSVQQADRVVIGPGHLFSLKSTLADWHEGTLTKAHFNEILSYLSPDLEG